MARTLSSVFLKACTKCDEIKEESAFPRAGRLKDGSPKYNSWCRECKNDYNRRPEMVEARRRYKMTDAANESNARYKSKPDVKARACELYAISRDPEADNPVLLAKYHETQRETIPAARNTGKEWTGPELELILRDGITAKDAAQSLGRTFASVRRMRQRCQREPQKIQLAGLTRG